MSSPHHRPRSFAGSFDRNKGTILSVVCGAAVAVGLTWWILNRNADSPTDDRQARDDAKKNQKSNPNDRVLAQKADTGQCRIYTKEPGFFVFINGEPARGRGEKWLTTPCAISLPRGGQEITVAKRGFRDAAKYVNVGRETEVVYENLPTAGDSQSSLLDDAYLRTRTDAPIALFSLNTPQRELDPFITPDGLTLYFASDRSQDNKKAVYAVSRKSRYAYFSKTPRSIESTQGPRMPGAPSLTADGLALVYTLPDLGIIKCVSRDSAVGEFSRKRSLPLRKQPAARWLTAQVVRDADRGWKFYGLLRQRGRRIGQTAVAVKKAERGGSLLPLGENRQEFGRPKKFDLRESPPCLSRDGLRQYFFDGKFLKRSIRPTLDAPFGEPQLLVSFGNIKNYNPAANRRTFSITDDEQWLVYESDGDMFLVRVFSRPRSELIVRGRSIPPRDVKVATVPANDPARNKPVPAKKKKEVDPRTSPLAYPPFRGKLVSLLEKREYDAAIKHAVAGLNDPKLSADLELVKWDIEDARTAAAFWNDFERAVAKMKPGDEFSTGQVRLTFVKFDKGDLVAKLAGQTVRKQSRLLKLLDAVNIVDKQLGRDDPKTQQRLATFWYYEKEGRAASAIIRFQRAAKAAATFVERLAQRRLQQARQEFARSNIGRALAIVAELRKDWPKSKAAAAGQALVDKAYAAVTWNSVGPRTWTMKNGTYTAPGDGRKPGSLLRSPQPFENFELRLEWKSDVPGGQGGVYFRDPGSGNPVDNAFKIQLADDNGGRVDRFCTGSLFKVQAPTSNPVKPQGAWNELVLRVRGESVTVIINGRIILEAKAASKTIPLKGYVALDGVLGGITYRKTLLVELAPAAK